MARSKLVQANEKIAQKASNGFKKMCDSVVGGYTKIEGGFIGRYLTREGETIEEARARLKKEYKERSENSSREKRGVENEEK